MYSLPEPTEPRDKRDAELGPDPQAWGSDEEEDACATIRIGEW
jgi:hypothetical protein